MLRVDHTFVHRHGNVYGKPIDPEKTESGLQVTVHARDGGEHFILKFFIEPSAANELAAGLISCLRSDEL